MVGAIIFEHIIDGESISEQTEMRGMIRLEQSLVKESGENVADQSGARTLRRERRSVPKYNIKV